MNFKSFLTEKKARVDEELRQIFNEKIETSDRPFLTEYYTTMREYISPEGGEAKRIRPILALVASEAFTNHSQEPIPEEILYRAVCSIELLHNASLVHDDIIDNDEFRRGQPAFHTVYTRRYASEVAGGTYVERVNRGADFGRNMGILGGDQTYFNGLGLLWNLPISAEVRIKLVETFQQAFNGIAEGVILEEHLANLPTLTLDDCLFMIQMKTAHLLVKATELGLILGGADPAVYPAMNRIMTQSGLAFQIRDDILGTFGDGSHKPADSDILESKKTFLLTYALQAATPDQLNLLQQIVGNPDATPEQVEEVRGVLRETNALSASEEKLEQLSAAASQALEEVQPNLTEFGWDFYNNFITFVSHRDF
ncbi:MAG TPA: polyprenyl synthetase family protein [Candidatus Lokiarchaeia archaeon]|nr:polyprenyl synthetase family protein [Candidatus Lokiarchaeia archaeon]